jgi:hypothetical protein
MDSKVINKLIRSEVWPILREQGFGHFESRNAFAYKGRFINVVHFQSFNSYLADGLGCTTYSFTVRLGTYVIGSPGKEYVSIDNAGRLMPSEPQCSFRTVLRKSTPVDGFAREDLFYIDPDGRTAAACFREVQRLLREFAPAWFEAQNDLDKLISRMHLPESSESSSDIDTSGSKGSLLWNQLKSVLLLTKHRQSPSQNSADAALGSINRAIGNVLGFSTIQSERPGQEGYAVQIRELWDQLGQFRPIPACNEKSTARNACLDGSIWETSETQHTNSISSPNPPVAARKQLWPILKNHGFSEFTDRLAHRVSMDHIEVVEFLPMDTFERKTWKLPEGLFRIGVGVFWPTLARDGLFRRNRNQESRPVANECHVSNWLAPQILTSTKARMAFQIFEDAPAALTGTGLEWLEIFRSHASTLSLLQRSDWELFWCYPMMRGYGACQSSQRLVYLARLQHLLGYSAESEDCLRRAEAAIPAWYDEQYREAQKRWIYRIKEQFRT